MKIAYPTMLFDRNILDEQAMMCSILTLIITNNQGMEDIEYGNIYDIYLPPAYLHLFEGPSCNILDLWRVLGRSLTTVESVRLPAFFENLCLQRHVTAGGGAFGHRTDPSRARTPAVRATSLGCKQADKILRRLPFIWCHRERPKLAMTISQRLLTLPRSRPQERT
jgi:hypothetical protein